MPIERTPWFESLASSSRGRSRINRGQVPSEKIGTDATYGRVCCYRALGPRIVKQTGEIRRLAPIENWVAPGMGSMSVMGIFRQLRLSRQVRAAVKLGNETYLHA